MQRLGYCISVNVYEEVGGFTRLCGNRFWHVDFSCAQSH